MLDEYGHLALPQRHSAVINIHDEAYGQAKGQVNRHDDRDNLNRVSVLIHDGVGHGNQVLIPDSNGER